MTVDSPGLDTGSPSSSPGSPGSTNEPSVVEPASAASDVETNREAMLAKLADLDAEHAKAVAGGGEKYVERHHARGKLLPRERIELLVDEGSAFLELSPLAGWGSDFSVGASLVTGIGVVEGVECLITANDPTVKGGASNPWTVKKAFRAAQIAEENHLPTISLVESGGADLPTQKEIFIPGGKLFRDLTRASARKQPTIALVFGNSTAGGAYVPGMSDYTVMVKGQAKVFLGGPPLVKMATGEDSDDESLGGAEMHARVSGLADYLAQDEHDAIRIGRRIVARLNWRKARTSYEAVAGATTSYDAVPWAEPDADPDGLLDLIPSDLKEPFDPREVIVRLVDGARGDGSGPGNERPFDEFKPLYGTSLVTGWARLHGRQLGILANAQGVLFSEEAQKAAQFIQLANQIDVPLLFLHNTTGYMVGAEYEQGGIIKHGAQMINAVSNSTVPHLSVIMGASYGAGNYGMNGRAYDPRFLFTWPSAKSAVMGPAQLAGVLSIVARAAAESRGKPYDDEADAGMRAFVEQSVEEQSLPFFLSGMLYDDGVIDPRDTRTVLAICLSVIDNAPFEGAGGYGVFRT
jgi:acyl-CoA carboxylase subunit beta